MKPLFQVVGNAFGSPAAVFHHLRQAGWLFLDLEFADASPLPLLPQRLLRKMDAIEVILPGRALQVDGTQSTDGLRFLATVAKVLGVRSVFEIGTFTGVTALTFALNIPQVTVHTLDLPATSAPILDVEHDDRKYMPGRQSERVFEHRLEAARIIQHSGDSARFDFPGLGQKFDLVYIDGSHSFEYVGNDTRAAFSIVADTGIVVWDDYQRDWPGVVRYLNERTDLALYRVPSTRLVVWLSDRAESTLNQ